MTPICKQRKQKHFGKHFTEFAYAVLITQSYDCLRFSWTGAYPKCNRENKQTTTKQQQFIVRSKCKTYKCMQKNSIYNYFYFFFIYLNLRFTLYNNGSMCSPYMFGKHFLFTTDGYTLVPVGWLSKSLVFQLDLRQTSKAFSKSLQLRKPKQQIGNSFCTLMRYYI